MGDMVKHCIGVVLWFVALAALSFPLLAEEEVDIFKHLEDAKGQPEMVLDTALKVMKSEDAYAGCPDTIYNCLKEEPENETILRIANFVVRRASKRLPEETIREDLKNRARSVYPPKVRDIDTKDAIRFGEKDAKIKVVAYSDFECPYCKIALPALEQIVKEHPKLVVLYFKQFPVKSHKRSIPAAKAGLAAHKQGKFWEIHDYFYKHQEFSDEAIEQAVKAVGLDMEKFKKDMQDKSIIETIRKQKIEGMEYGVKGTPGLFINGKFYVGPKTEKELLDRIMEEKAIMEGKQL